MLHQPDATPCPDNLHGALTQGRESLISNCENDTADIDFTTEFRATLRAAAPKRRQTSVRTRRTTGLGFSIHEDEEVKCFQSRDISIRSPAQKKYATSIMSQPPQRFQPRVNFASNINDQNVKDRSAKLAQPMDPSTTAAKPLTDSRIKKPARRGTVYVPTEDTTMPTIFMGVFSPIKDLAAGMSAAHGHHMEEITGIAAQMAQKKVSRKSLAAAPPKRAPLQNPLRPSQERVGFGDRPGQKTGKENIPPGQTEVGRTKSKAQKELFEINHARTSPRGQPISKDYESRRRTSVLSTSQQTQPFKTTVRAPPRRSILPATIGHPGSHISSMPDGDRPSEAPAQLRSSKMRNDSRGDFFATKVVVPCQTVTVPAKLSMPSCEKAAVYQRYPLLDDDIIDPSMYEENWLGHQEIAISQLLNNLMSGHNTSPKPSRRNLRLELLRMYQSDSFSLLHKRLKASLLYGTLGVPKDVLSKASRLFNDLGLRKRFLDLWTKTYRPSYLRAAAEVVVGRQCPNPGRSSNTSASPNCTRSPKGDRKTIEVFLETFLVRNEDFEKQMCASTSNLSENAYRRTIQRSLLLIQVLDRAKTSKLPLVSGALFLTTSPYKSSANVLQALASMLLPSHGDITRQLSHLDYSLTHVQYPLEEYNYVIENMAVDLRDGVRLTRLVEILLYPSISQLLSRPDSTTTIIMPTGEILGLLEGSNDWPLSQHLRFPCLGRATKIFNVQIALSALRGIQGMETVLDGVTADDIVDGYREKTVSLLWGLVVRWGVGYLVDFGDIQKQIRMIRKCLGESEREDEEDELSLVEDGFDDSEVQLRQLRAWAATIAAGQGIKVQNLTTSFSDGRVFTAIVDYYSQYLPSNNVAETPDAPLNTRLQALGCSLQFSNLFSKTERIIDQETTTAALAFLASRVLGATKPTRAALTIQRAWRSSLALKETRKRIVKSRLAKECAVVVSVKDRLIWAKLVILKAWRNYQDKKGRQPIPLKKVDGTFSSEASDIWLCV